MDLFAMRDAERIMAAPRGLGILSYPKDQLFLRSHAEGRADVHVDLHPDRAEGGGVELAGGLQVADRRADMIELDDRCSLHATAIARLRSRSTPTATQPWRGRLTLEPPKDEGRRRHAACLYARRAPM